jgi:hypothetical protein
VATRATLTTLIFTFMPISGEHFNPAVRVADASQGGHIIAQTTTPSPNVADAQRAEDVDQRGDEGMGLSHSVRNGKVWPMPPKVVIKPQTPLRIQGRPLPLRTPSSERASANPILISAPSEAAIPRGKRSKNYGWQTLPQNRRQRARGNIH